MNFMPNIGSLVRLDDGRLAIVSSVTPDGSGDRVRPLAGGAEEAVDAWKIAEIIHEPEPGTDL